MKLLWLLFLTTAYCYHRNIILIGLRKDTFLLAKRFSEFYNVPLLEEPCFFFPKHFILIRDTIPLSYNREETDLIRLQDYPHTQKPPNYFISWWKQNF